MNNAQQPTQREIVFCHRCENEWYRDEHGIICPECDSEFTEIIEANNDPRQEEDQPLPGGPHGFYAPDPDEEDIDNFHFHPNGPGETPGGRLHFNRTININPNGPQGGAGGGGGLLGLLGPAIQGLMGGQRQQQSQDDGQPGQPREGQHHNPGSPHVHHEQFLSGNGGTFTRVERGPNYSFSITTTSNGNLFPRNANGPQPFQNQPDNINHMMAQIFGNIGIAPGQGFGGPQAGMRAGGPMFMEMGTGPHGGPPGMPPLAHLFQMFGVPAGGVHGDAVYDQESLDRIISQLMEQHRSGNAPPPASAEAIDSLPQRPITQKDIGDGDKADCSICMDEAELGSLVTELPCGHWFHHDCIKAWLGEHDTCPHCRQGITPKDSAGNDGRARQPSQAALHDIHRDHASSTGANTSQQSNESSGGLFGRLRQTFSPSSSNQQNQQVGSGGANAPGR